MGAIYDTKDDTRPSSKSSTGVRPKNQTLTLDDRYRLEHPIGRGGMGAVYLAHDGQTNTKVAIKLLARTDEQKARQRFLHEIGMAFEVSHPNIVRALGYGIHDAVPYLVMEYVQGISLREHILEQGALTEKTALHIGGELLKALIAIHKRALLHRDVKPANVMLVGGNLDEIKVLDFGVARNLALRARLTDDNSLIGTPSYLPPERLKNQPETPASDIYGVGLLVHECLTGQKAFSSQENEGIASVYDSILAQKKSSSLPNTVSSETEYLVEKATQVDPNNRYSSAEEMLSELQHIRPA